MDERKPNYLVISLVVVLTAVIILLGIVFANLPSTDNLNTCFVTAMHQVHYCPSGENWVQIDEISEALQMTILISEDAGFYQHKGVDFREVYESTKTNLKRKKFARGGSTISQQLVKNLYLSGDKTLLRKLKEAVLTMKLESVMSKDRIFESYLNVVQFGDDVFGIKAAAAYYFNKLPADLTLVEGAFLAHLLPNPEVYSRGFLDGQLTEYNIERMTDIINKLYLYKKISDEEHLMAINELEALAW